MGANMETDFIGNKAVKLGGAVKILVGGYRLPAFGKKSYIVLQTEKRP